MRRNIKPFPVSPLVRMPPPEAADVPPGHLQEIVHWLEMHTPPPVRRDSGRLDSVALMRARRPAVSFYRYLYNAIGEAWLWHERRRLDDEALRAIIHDPQVRINVLYHRGSPAGYAELDLRTSGEVEVAYFGLLPEYFGRGLGGFLLRRAIEQAWRTQPRRVWLHTCNFDSRGALGLYQKNGFVIYKRQSHLIVDPRTEGTLPASAAPHIPISPAPSAQTTD